jgi:serine/threonine protein kinase
MSEKAAMSVPGANAFEVSTRSSEPFPPAISDHELLHQIGSGAYGDVWLARSILGELRAVKVIYRSRFSDARPFEREFEGIQRFEPISRSHPSQLAILHVGKNETSGCFYYVMELADDASSPVAPEVTRLSSSGPKLDQTLVTSVASKEYLPRTLRHDLDQHGRLPVRDCVQIGLSLTTALSHLHQHGLVHRDIKPSNVIFVNGVPKLSDIGLVTEAGDTQSIVGTEGYIPPEGPGTAQADIFSLGKVLYEIGTGMDRRRAPELPRDLRSWPDFAAAVEFNEIVLRACASEPARRYQSAQEIRSDLAVLQQGRSVRQRYARQHYWAVLRKAGFATVLVITAVLFVSHFLRRGTDHYAKSPISRVNFLVEQGFVHIRGETMGKTLEAVAEFTEAVQLDPHYLPALNGLYHAHVHLESPDWLENLRANARKLTALSPKSSEACQAVAFVEWREEHFFDALEGARRATRLPAASMEASAYAHLEYGFFLTNVGDSAGASREYQKAYAIYPEDPIIQDHLGHPYFMRRQFRKAFDYYLASVNLQPDHLNGHHWLGQTYEELELFDKAIEEFKTLDRLNRVDAAARKNFYDDLLRAVHERGAKGYWGQRLTVALSRSPQHFYEIANMYAHLGEKQKAYEYLGNAHEHQEFMEDLMFEPWWDHNDPEFQVIARKVGLMR